MKRAHKTGGGGILRTGLIGVAGWGRGRSREVDGGGRGGGLLGREQEEKKPTKGRKKNLERRIRGRREERLGGGEGGETPTDEQVSK